MTELSRNPAWQALQVHYHEIRHTHIRDLLADEPKRKTEWAIEAAGLYFDYTRHRATSLTLDKLAELAQARDIAASRQAMMRGEAINISENRPALHTALRAGDSAQIHVNGRDIMPDVRATRETMRTTSETIRNGTWCGATGRPIRDVVNIGIGGSDLGPRLACDALKRDNTGPRVHFLANIDGHVIDRLLQDLDPETTLFIIASKSFTTSETLHNAYLARQWIEAHLGISRATAISRHHFIAITSHVDKAREFGIPGNNILDLPEWVGGRFSLWSATGLPISIACGHQSFENLLAGAQAMDTHFAEAPYARNMPVMAALLGVWYRNFFGSGAHAVLCYDERLSLLPAWLQQLDMESNGKSFDRHGTPLDYATGPVIFGGTGTNAQHAFFQHLHQGHDLIPCDFICTKTPDSAYTDSHLQLLANCLAQLESLALGAPDSGFAGNTPTNAIVLPGLNGYYLGSMLAFYEHKIACQGFIWNLNSFDQPGVELGKSLMPGMYNALSTSPDQKHHATHEAVQGLCNKLKT